MPSIIKEWENYQKGKDYNRRMPTDFYTLCNRNANFEAGEQWEGAGLDPDFNAATFNIIQKMVTFFNAFIASSKIALKYASPVGLEDTDLSDDVLNASFEEFRERVKFDKMYRQALKDGCITGDFIAHLIFTDKKPYNGAYSDVVGQVDMVLVDATNFYVADPTDKDMEGQEYLQIDGRSFVSVLNKEKKEAQTTIIEDNDTETQIGDYGDIEFEPILDDDHKTTGQATWVLTYTKKKEEDGEEWVYASKCTSNGYVYKDRPMGFNLYPIAFGNWITQKNTYHGQSFVKNVIPAQIFINQGFTMAMKHTMDTAFSKFFYDMDAIDGITAEVSTQVGVKLRAGQSIDQVGKFMTPGNMSDKVIAMIDLAYNYIKDVVSLTDSITGNVNPEQASGVSIISSAKQSAIPIEIPQLNSYDWIEDIGRIYKNMIENLYGERPILLEEDGVMVVGDYDFGKLKNMYKPAVIEVGESSYWSEDNLIATLDNLFAQGIFDVIDYLEEMPDGKIPGKDKIIKKLKAKAAAEAPPTPQETPEMAQLTEPLL